MAIVDPGAAALIQQLQLAPHPEGGHYRETWRTGAQVATPHGLRAAATAILFLLAAGERSRWHRLRSDETWFHQGGGPLRIHEICRDGSLRQTRLGMDIQAGESPQHVVPAGHWFCAEPLAAEGWSLVGCCVAPGFSFEDFELATLSQLEQHRRILEADCPHWRTFCRPAAGPQDQA